eukprot:9984529-Prorocentrum_lima.AAC.1
MTSSLVGSEMCIRDRARGAQRGQRRRTSPSSSPTLRQKGHPGPRCLPVSYTHLTLPTICSV